MKNNEGDILCWYAKGRGKVSLILAAGIISVLFNMTFVYRLPSYINIRSALELLIFICGCVVLAPILDAVIPFNFIFHFG